MKLSAIIPAHDAEPFLAASIDSVLRELPSDAELIVVDDGSRDGTPGVLASYGGRIRVLRNREAVGPGGARNCGARAARGDILGFHDADDIVLPGRFTELVAVLDRDPSIDLVFANGIQCDEHGRPRGRILSRGHARRFRRRIGLSEMLPGGFIYPQATCIRRDCFLQIGGYGPGTGEDWEFAMRASLALRLAFVDRPVFAYRRHAKSITMQKAEFAHILLAVIERFVAEHPELERVVPRWEIERAVARQLARCAKYRLMVGDPAGALDVLSRAVALAPGKLRYRWKLLKLKLRQAAPPAGRTT